MKKSLYFQADGSDKEYHVQVVQKENGYVVDFQYGRRNSALQSGTKTPTPVTQAEAEKIFIKLCNEKIRKGYKDTGEEGGGGSGEPFAKSVDVVFPVQLLNEIEDPQNYIDNDNFVGQEKFDGERRAVIFSTENIVGINKKGQALTLPPAIVESLPHYSTITIDGEIIGEMLYAFDIVEWGGGDLSKLPLVERLAVLNKVLFGKQIVVVPTAYTREEKQAMFDRIKAENGEGIVFKKKDAPYTPGRPNSGGNALKFKFHKTGTFIVVGSTPGKRSVGLEMINEKGERQFMGKVTIPPNKEIPDTGDLVEVRYLYAFPGEGKIFQPFYLDKRTDADLSDCTTKQLIYKKD